MRLQINMHVCTNNLEGYVMCRIAHLVELEHEAVHYMQDTGPVLPKTHYCRGRYSAAHLVELEHVAADGEGVLPAITINDLEQLIHAARGQARLLLRTVDGECLATASLQ